MATELKTGILRPPKAPNLPIATIDYSKDFQDQFSNALRLYFNQIDNFTQPFAGCAGGDYLKFPYGAFSSYVTQTGFCSGRCTDKHFGRIGRRTKSSN